MRTVSCMRGGRTPLPTVRVVSPDELLTRLTGDDTRSDEERLRGERWLDGLSLFSLAPRRYDAQQADADAIAQYAAVYLGDSKEVLVVDRGKPLDSEQAVQLFAHELTHALQDAEHGLRAWRERWVTDVDSSIASDAVVEGEAVFYELMVRLQLEGRDPHDIDWQGYFTEWRAEQLARSELDEAPLTMADVRFPYAFGGGYVTQHWLAGGRDAIRALWRNPPLTTREVMFGEFADDRASELDVAQSSLPQLGDGFSLVAHSKLGAWMLRQFVARMRVPLTARLLAPEVLAYDWFSVQVNEASGELVTGWRFEFDEARSLPRLDDHIEAHGSNAGEWFLVASDQQRDLRTLVWGARPGSSAGSVDRTASARRHHAARAFPPPPRIDATR